MKLNALLMTQDRPSQRVLMAVLDLLGIGQESCPTSAQAVELMVQGHYSAMVLDFDLPGAGQVVRMAHLVEARRRPVVFAMVSAFTPVGGAFESGVNFILYKPLVCEQVARSFRGGQAAMPHNPRHSPRHQLETLAYLQVGTVPVPAIVLDLSEQGLAVQAPEPLPRGQAVPLHFVLPGTSQAVEGTGEIIWSDDEGRAGIFFSSLDLASRHHLKSWLNKRGGKAADAVRVLLPPRRARRSTQTTN